MEALWPVVRAVAGIGAVLFALFALLSYESEEERFQSFLEELWMRLDDRSKERRALLHAAPRMGSEIHAKIIRAMEEWGGPGYGLSRPFYIGTWLGLTSLFASIALTLGHTRPAWAVVVWLGTFFCIRRAHRGTYEHIPRIETTPVLSCAAALILSLGIGVSPALDRAFAGTLAVAWSGLVGALGWVAWRICLASMVKTRSMLVALVVALSLAAVGHTGSEALARLASVAGAQYEAPLMMMAVATFGASMPFTCPLFFILFLVVDATMPILRPLYAVQRLGSKARRKWFLTVAGVLATLALADEGAVETIAELLPSDQ